MFHCWWCIEDHDNKCEITSSGNEEDAMMFSGDTNSDSSLSEPAYIPNWSVSKYMETFHGAK
jgi:hypothetical protein